MELKIDSEFKSLIPSLAEKEFSILEQEIKVNGCHTPLMVWGNVIVDGHNRYKICREHQVHFDVHHLNFKNRDEAIDWMLKNQLGRRNLSRDDFNLLIGRLYNRRKKAAHGRADRDLSGGQNDHPKSTAETIAAEHNVSPKTVRRYGKFAEAVEQVQQEKPGADKKEVMKEVKEAAKPKPKKEEKEVAREEERPNYEVAMKYARIMEDEAEGKWRAQTIENNFRNWAAPNLVQKLNTQPATEEVTTEEGEVLQVKRSFRKAFEKFKKELEAAKSEQWADTPFSYAASCLGELNNIL